jgi:hypothetical protein
MAEPSFSSVGGMGADDDLPRTLRREREAQARRARETELAATEPAISPEAPPHFEPDNFDYEDAPPATVTRLDVPFLHLMLFFLKAVIAGIPALILLLTILWGIGEILTATFPELIKMQVLIRMPN